MLPDSLTAARSIFAREHRSRCEGNLLIRRHFSTDDCELMVLECSRCYSSIVQKTMTDPRRDRESFIRFNNKLDRSVRPMDSQS